MHRRTAATAIAWVTTIPFAGWAAVRLLGLDSGYPLEAMMPFTPYVAAGSLTAVALAFGLRRPAPAVLAAVAAICLGGVVLPRSWGSGTVSADGKPTLKVLAANVHEGGASAAGLIRLVDELHPEVVTVEEFTPRFGRELAAAGLGSRLAYHVLDPEPRARGTAIYSSLPLRQLPTAPFFFRMARATATLPGGGKVRMVAVHTIPPRHSSYCSEWEEELSALPSGGHGTPWLLAGDFNATLDQTPFRELVVRGYRDAGEVAGKGLDATFPADGSIFPPPITIDHVLADERWGIARYEVEPLPGSDHKAVFAELVLP